MDITRKSKITMIDHLEAGLTNWSELEFYSSSNSQQHVSHSSPKKSALSYDYTDLTFDFLDTLESSFANDPLIEEVMNCKVDSQGLKGNLVSETTADVHPYLNASVFMSPLSTAPSSPNAVMEDEQTQIIEEALNASEFDDVLLKAAEFDETSGMDYFNRIFDADLEWNKVHEKQLLSIAESLSDESNEFMSEGGSGEISTHVDSPAKETNKRARSSDSDESIGDSVWEPVAKPVRKQRRGMPPEIKKERKKNQNKNAANRYRLKKRAEQDAVDSLENEQLRIQEQLQKRLEQIQTEYRVVLDLAKNAFRNDPVRSSQVKRSEEKATKHCLI